MRSKPLFRWALFATVVSLVFAGSASAQVVFSAHQGTVPVQVGFGVSDWFPNWGGMKYPMLGITGTVDFHPPMPRRLSAVGIEGEYRTVSMRKTVQPPNYKEQTIAGGLTYTYSRGQNLRFYGKGMIGLGIMDFTSTSPTYTHDSRTLYAPGGGVQYRLHSGIWLRGDYEYQFWQPLFSLTKRPTPSGLTVGVGYDLHGFHRQY